MTIRSAVGGVKRNPSTLGRGDAAAVVPFSVAPRPGPGGDHDAARLGPDRGGRGRPAGAEEVSGRGEGIGNRSRKLRKEERDQEPRRGKGQEPTQTTSSTTGTPTRAPGVR